MVAEVNAALVAAVASILVSGASFATAVWTSRRADRSQRDLEALKAHLSDTNDAAKAKRDYEYEARKRLYTELYPLAFQLHEASNATQNKIRNLALAARGGWLADGENNWLTSGDPYYFTSVIHSLIAPLAVYELMTRKLTLLDLALEPDLYWQHSIARKAYEALRSDFNLIEDPPYPPLVFGEQPHTYAPPEGRPTSPVKEAEQRWTWRQGLYSGHISQAVDALLADTGASPRVLTYAEFAKALAGVDLRADDDAGGPGGAMKRALGPLIELLRGFHPARRPITWRILLAQAACYRALAAARDGIVHPERMLKTARYAGAPDQKAFDWIGVGGVSIPPALAGLVDFAAEQESAQATADIFIGKAIEGIAGRLNPRRGTG